MGARRERKKPKGKEVAAPPETCSRASAVEGQGEGGARVVEGEASRAVKLRHVERASWEFPRKSRDKVCACVCVCRPTLTFVVCL